MELEIGETEGVKVPNKDAPASLSSLPKRYR